jgi:AcrR family transcriptional regulator
MAREPARKPRKPRQSADPAASSAPPPAGTARDRIVDALMALAAARDWDEIRLGDIAAEAGLTLAELREHVPSKGAILAAFNRRIDRVVLEGTSDDLADESAKDRVFDVMMRRFDALAPYRDALKRIVPALRRDPLALGALNGLALNSQRYMLESAGVDTEGPMGAVKLQGAVLVFARVLDTWLEDEDPGFAKTMAALDRELTRGGRILGGLSDACRLTAPFRAIFTRAADRGRRARERQRARREPRDDGYDDDMVTAV